MAERSTIFRSASTLGLARQPTSTVLKGLAAEDIPWPEKVPKWDPISAYADCYQCASRKHKHNCRLCGHLFCRNCTDKIDGVPARFRLKNKKGKVRVCVRCLADLAQNAKSKGKNDVVFGSAATPIRDKQGSLKPDAAHPVSRAGSSHGDLASLRREHHSESSHGQTGSQSSTTTAPPVIRVFPSDAKDAPPPQAPPTVEPPKKKIGFSKMSNMLGENMAMFAYLTRVKYPVPAHFDDLKADLGCYLCKSKSSFSLTQFLNHCRLCGHLYCARCTNKFSIPRRYLSAQDNADEMGRVCYGCEAKCRFGADLDIAANIKAPRLIANPTIHDLVITIPKWANPALYKSCTKCTKESRQGHNCRLCGMLFCDKCTSKMSVPSGYDKKSKKGDVRVCDRCRFLVLAGATISNQIAPVETETAAMLGELGHMADELSREFLDKLRKAACVGCDTNFHMLNRRHQCPYCRLSWCNSCITAHLLKEAKESNKKEAQLKKSRPPQRKPVGELPVGEVVDTREVSAENVLKVQGGPGRAAIRKLSRGDEPFPSACIPVVGFAHQQANSGEKQGTQEDSKVEAKAAPADAKSEGKEGPGFEILCRLGEGSYGAVYKATDKRDGQLVAIKVIEDQAENLESLYKEIGFLEGCKHDHIVAYKGTFQMKGQTCICMEYCCGGSLNDIMEVCDRTFEEKEIAVIMREALIGLHYLHAANKMHRDVKSGNILVNDRGECKLADFGVSCALTTPDERRKTIIGTPYWMAPEVLQAKEKGGYDCKSDIWSLGITAMELAKGVPPHSDMHPMRVIFKIPYVSPPKLPDPDNWSQEFMDFIAQCLVKDYTVRPTAEQLLNHKFITGAGPIAVLADLVSKSMTEIDNFRKQEDADVKKEENLAGTATVSETSVSRGSRNVPDEAVYGTMVLDEVHTTEDASVSQIGLAADAFESPDLSLKGKQKKEKKPEVTMVFGTTQVSSDLRLDENSYLGSPSLGPQSAPSTPQSLPSSPKKGWTISELRQFGTTLVAPFGTTMLDLNKELAQDSYLAQVASAAKAKYEAEEAATSSVAQLVASAGDWQICRDQRGEVYYSNIKTKTVTWEQPPELDGAGGEIAYAVNVITRQKTLPQPDDETDPTTIISLSKPD